MYDFEKICDNLTEQDIINIMLSFGAVGIQKDGYIIFPTVCHNTDIANASMKLYYYTDSKRFHCYTQCGETFNIFGLIKRIYKVRQIDYNIVKVAQWLGKQAEGNIFFGFDNVYKTIKNRYRKKPQSVELTHYPKDLINYFIEYYPPEWLNEDISKESMDKFNIRFSIAQMKIIIPHYDIEGNLIGIRGRTLVKEEEQLYGKYMPVKINDTIYKHPLSLNLYGLNESKKDITDKIVLFESEKSVLKYDGYFDKNISAAVCGSNFNKNQLAIIKRNLKVNEVIIAFDKEFRELDSKKCSTYFNKLKSICDKYSNYVKMSFIWDSHNLLEEKDSPIDKGKETFQKLYDTRIRIGD